MKIMTYRLHFTTNLALQYQKFTNKRQKITEILHVQKKTMFNKMSFKR